jgi:hypothetical protein
MDQSELRLLGILRSSQQVSAGGIMMYEGRSRIGQGKDDGV